MDTPNQSEKPVKVLSYAECRQIERDAALLMRLGPHNPNSKPLIRQLWEFLGFIALVLAAVTVLMVGKVMVMGMLGMQQPVPEEAFDGGGKGGMR